MERVTDTIPRFFIFSGNHFAWESAETKTNFYAKEIFVLRARMWYLCWGECYKVVFV
ncbi:MAG: hypothetical protein J6V74_07225 [Bacteroidales bacterium]|nr:hypothetical protein [Bacteroidales bacterium]